MAESSVFRSATTMNSGGAPSFWASRMTVAPLVSGRAREKGGGVGAGGAAGGGAPAGEAPEPPGAEPVGHDGDEDRGTRAGPAEEAAERDGRDAEDEEGAEGRERPARHARFPMKNTIVHASAIFARRPK